MEWEGGLPNSPGAILDIKCVDSIKCKAFILLGGDTNFGGGAGLFWPIEERLILQPPGVLVSGLTSKGRNRSKDIDSRNKDKIVLMAVNMEGTKSQKQLLECIAIQSFYHVAEVLRMQKVSDLIKNNMVCIPYIPEHMQKGL